MFNSSFMSKNAGVSNLDDLRRQYEQQMSQINYIQRQQEEARPSSVIEEMNKEILSLSQDEREMLALNETYLSAKQIYEASFMEFLGNKFSMEFINGEGKGAAENLLNSIKKIKQDIQLETKEKKRKLDALSKLMESDDEIADKIREIIKKG